jgi:hypothetical protein
VVLGGRLSLTFRELNPKDFYFFSLINNDYPDISQGLLLLMLMQRLGNLSEDDLSRLPAKYVKPLSDWIGPTLLEDRVMKIDQWLEMAFHLCKQRWDASIEWLETQPVSKILLMADILSRYVDKQNEEMKRSNRRR